MPEVVVKLNAAVKSETLAVTLTDAVAIQHSFETAASLSRYMLMLSCLDFVSICYIP